jgi:hypothetical protein
MRRVSLLTSTTATANKNNDDTASAAVVDNSNHHPNAETMTLSAILALAGVTHPLKSEDTHSSIQLDGSNTTTLNLATDGNKTMTELGLVHGSTITILKSSSSSSVSSDNHLGRHSKTNSNDKKKKRNEDDERFDPFPELATSSSRTTSIMSRRSRREKAMKQNKRLHIIEPQSTSTTKDVIKRVYVCERSAAKFRNHCISTATTAAAAAATKKKRKAAVTAATTIMENRVGLLFGTIERSSNNVANNGIINSRSRKTMSSNSGSSGYEKIVNVHAIWEPTNQKPSSSNQYIDHYDDTCLLLPSTATTTTTMKDEEEEVVEEVDIQRAIRIGRWLGLRPVGWIFSYTNNDRTKEVDSRGTTVTATTTSTTTALPPIYVRDVIMGSKLQIQTMKYNRMLNRNDNDDDDGQKDFVTLAMNCIDGMTESFQYSNVCVQMVAEGVLSLPEQTPQQQDDDGNTRLAKLPIPVLVSDEETTILDTVLLLINLAMFSHVGLYSGDATVTATGGSSVKRSTGELLTKTRKRILTLLLEAKKKQQQQRHQQQYGSGDDTDNIHDDEELLKLLCDFDILLALDVLLDRDDSEKLCLLVKQYATTVKNKKMTTKKKKKPIVDKQLRLTLQTVLDYGL